MSTNGSAPAWSRHHRRQAHPEARYIDGPEIDVHIIDWDKFLPRFGQCRAQESRARCDTAWPDPKAGTREAHCSPLPTVLRHASAMGAAGASSRDKYKELSRRWRRINRRLFIALGAICAVIIVASLVVAERWSDHAWVAGFLGGGAAAFFMAAWLSPPGWIENWQSGAFGEEATAKALRPLEREGWVVLHDLPAERGNVDHIVIGPPGVFLLDSKRLSGTVRIDGDGLATVDRGDDDSLSYRHPGGKHLLSLARETHSRGLASTRIRLWVAPVMVIWADFPQRVVDENRCVYVHGDELVPWLRAREQRIAPSRMQTIVEAVTAAWASNLSVSQQGQDG
jgi:hypothetical protein